MSYVTFDINFDPRDERAAKQSHDTLEEAAARIIADNDEHAICVFTRHPRNPGELVPVPADDLIAASQRIL